MVLWLDDAHWADHATRGFLAFLAASLADDARLLTVIAYRSDQLHRRHPMRPLLAELGRGRRVRRLELEPFDRGEVATQLSDILGAAPDPEVVERFFERGEGNPLFTEELLAAGSDGRGRLPSTLRDALLLRIERLPETLARRAAAPRRRRAPQTRPLRRRLRGRARTSWRRGCARRSRRRWSLVGRDDRYGFRHALLREVIYDDLLPGERAELHLRLAQALEPDARHRGRPPGDPRRRRRPPLQRRGRPAAGAAQRRRAPPARSNAAARRAPRRRCSTGRWRSGRGSPNRRRWRGSNTSRCSPAPPAPTGSNADEAHAITLYDQALGEVDEAERAALLRRPARRNRLGALGDGPGREGARQPRPGARPAARVRTDAGAGDDPRS